MGLVRRVRMAGRTAVGVLGLLGLVVSFVFVLSYDLSSSHIR